MVNILSLISERIESFFVLMKEGYRLKDKMILFRYYLKGPLQLLNYLIGIKNPRKLKGDVYIKNQYGLFFCGDNFASIYGCGSMSESVMRKHLGILNKGIFVDLGANCGMFTIPLARMLKENGKVISIEPDKRNIDLLRKNVELNKLDNVIIIEKGTFSKKENKILYIDNIGTGGHTLLKKDGARQEIISVDKLDNILRELNVNHVNLIKMDVMGVEFETFEGAKETLKRDHPKIIFELLHKEDRDRVYKFLSQYNYKIKQITNENHLAI